MTSRRRRPAGIVPVAVIAVAFVALPLVGLLWKAPWRSTWAVLGSHEALTALRLSLVTSVAATVVAVVLGLPLAWVLARIETPVRPLLRALTTLPMVLPPVVGGTALLLALGRRGVVGRYLGDVGIHLPFHMTGAVLAEAFVAMPFFVLSAEAAFRAVDTRLEDAARTLGSSPWRVLRTITVPLARPGLVTGTVLTWARALGEFGATITFAGNFPGRTQTLPLFVYVQLEGGDRDAAIVLSLVLLVVSLAVLVALRDRWFR